MYYDSEARIFRLEGDDRTLLGISDDSCRTSYGLASLEDLQEDIEAALDRERKAYLAIPDRELMQFPMLETTYELARDALLAMRAKFAAECPVTPEAIDAELTQLFGDEDL